MVNPAESGFFRTEDSQTLVVLLHGYMFKPARLEPLRLLVQKKLPEADVLIPRLPLNMLSFSDLNEIG
jgi:hypothetical protein